MRIHLLYAFVLLVGQVRALVPNSAFGQRRAVPTRVYDGGISRGSLLRRAIVGTVALGSFSNEPERSGGVDISDGVVARRAQDIHLLGPITQVSCFTLGQAIRDAAATPNATEVRLHISSMGGSLVDAMAVVAAIEASPVPVNTFVSGYAASAAALIFCSGHVRTMHSTGSILIHEASTTLSGTEMALEKEMHNLNHFTSLMRQTFIRHSGGKLRESNLVPILQADRWIGADEAYRLGLVDVIV